MNARLCCVCVYVPALGQHWSYRVFTLMLLPWLTNPIVRPSYVLPTAGLRIVWRPQRSMAMGMEGVFGHESHHKGSGRSQRR